MPGDCRFAEVAVVGKVDRLLTYRIPESLLGRVKVGCAVRVPLQARHVAGFVVSLERQCEIAGVRDILGLLDAEPVISDELLRLGRWTADYYLASLGEVLRRALPPGMARAARRQVRLLRRPSEDELRQWRKARPAWVRIVEEVEARSSVYLGDLARLGRGYPAAARRLAAKGVLEVRQELAGKAVGPKRKRWVHALAKAEHLRAEAERIRAKAPKLAQCLDLLADRGGAVPQADLLAEAGITSDAVHRLARKGWVQASDQTAERRAGVLWHADRRPGYEMTPAQVAAAEKIDERLRDRRFHAVLLHGITGSGKTEVYLRAIAGVLEQGRKALILVPEISLAAQTVGRIHEKFGARVEVYHSALSPGERRDSWFRIRQGRVDVVVGARSAVFVPLAPLGLIVVDEEQETAYKESESPRYHARDVALVRAKLAGALAILCSATPSFETFHNALRGKYERMALEDRVEGRSLPPVEIVDLRAGPRRRARVVSLELSRKIEEALGRKQQVMLFLNRRSFAPHVQCPSCGWVSRCTSCDIALAYHARGRQMKCHLCGHREPAVETCPECGHRRLRYSGVGTQRVEREIRDRFPSARIARMDFDTTQRRGAHAEIIDRFRRHDVDILLGTQMIAKGLDFPGVSLVGVINADTALHLPDFRASERTFDLLTQVAGRTGRGDVGGEVLIQTYVPSHPSLEYARNHDFVGFYRRAIEARQAAHYPPQVRLIRLICEGPDLETVSKRIGQAAACLEDEIRRAGCSGTEVVGPAPAGFERLKGKYRWHLILKTTEPASARRAVRSALARTARGRCRMIVDVDPLDMM